ncbi:class I adenylate-forming enzyme family protein [Nocardioides sp. GXZ039]|uniref:class I adenylate-forming enzyme family protein n=1 Tax=Nocardioides sp. GXZ039 TaxID=3136018 RepID=UPI0030F476F4
MTATSEALEAAGDKVLLFDTHGHSRTGNELLESVGKVAGALHDAGLSERAIGYWYTNSIAAFEAALAIEWVGGTRVPVDPGAAVTEAQAIWSAAGVMGRISDAAHAKGIPVDVIHDDDTPAHGAARGPLKSVPSQRTYLLYPRAVQSGELLAVPISYGNWEATMMLNTALYRSGAYGPGFGEDECFLTVQQLMHGTGLVGSFPFLRMGLAQYVFEQFDADHVLDLIEDGSITSTMMVTAMVERLADKLDERPRSLGNLRRLLYGGAPMPAERLQHVSALMPDVLVQIYGRLEGGWPLAVLDQQAHAAIAQGDPRVTSCGQPVAGLELALRSGGEVAVRSAMVVDEFADPDGWCGLGDVGMLDDGHLYLRGRLDRMINTGYHVYPSEIEAVIREIDEVDDVLVHGEPDPKWGERVVAVVASGEADAVALKARLDAHVRSRLAAYKAPRKYVVVNQLPAT